MNPSFSAENELRDHVPDESGLLTICSSSKRTAVEMAVLLLIYWVSAFVVLLFAESPKLFAELRFSWEFFVPLLCMGCFFVVLYSIFAHDDEYTFNDQSLIWKQDGKVKKVIPWRDVKSISGYYITVVLKDGSSIHLNSNFGSMGKLAKALKIFHRRQST